MAKTLDFIVRLRDQASKALRGVSGSLERMRGIAASPAFSALGTFFGAAAAVGIARNLISTMANFEESMNKVGAVSKANQQEMKALEKAARDLGATTRYSAAEVADGMTFMAMAGFEVNEIVGAMPNVLQLATAASLDMASAADISSNILTGYGLQVEDLARVNDVLVAAMTNANVDLRGLGEAMKYAGPIASGMGVSFEEAAAAIALMGNAGIQGSMAGTSLRNALKRLAAPTGKAAKLVKQLGLDAAVAADGSIDLVKTVRILEGHLKDGMDQAELTALAIQIFGDRAGPAMAALVAQGGDALENFIRDLEKSEGVAAETADRMNKGLNAQLRALKSAWEELALTIGDTGVLNNATGAVSTLTEALREFTNNLKDKGFWSGLFQSIAGTIVEWSGFLVDTFFAIVQKVGTFVASIFGPDFAAEFEQHVQEIRSIIEGVVTAIGNWIRGEPIEWESLFSGLFESGRETKALFADIWTAIKGITAKTWIWITETASAAVEGVKAVWQGISEFFSILWQGIVAGITWLGDTIIAIGTGIADFFLGMWASITGTSGQAVSAIQGYWQSFVAWLFTTFPQIPQLITLVVQIIQRLWSLAVQQAMSILIGIIQIWETISEGVLSIVDSMVNTIVTYWTLIVITAETILAGIVAVFEGIWAAVAGALTSLAGIIIEAWSSLVSALTGLFDAIYQAAVSLWENIAGAAEGPLQTLASALENVLNNMLNAVEGTLGEIASYFAQKFAQIKSVVSLVSAVMRQFFTNAMNAMKRAADRFLDGLLRKVKAVAGAIGLNSIWPDLMDRMVAVTENWANKSDQILYNWSKNTISVHMQTAEAIEDTWREANRSINQMSQYEGILPSRYQEVERGKGAERRVELKPDREAMRIWKIYQKNMGEALGAHEEAILKEEELYHQQIEQFQAFAANRGTSQDVLNRWIEDAAKAHNLRLQEIDQAEIQRRQELWIQANEGMLTQYDLDILREKEQYQERLDAYNEFAMLMNLSREEMNAWTEEAELVHQQRMAEFALAERDRQYATLMDTATMWAQLLEINTTQAQMMTDMYMQFGTGISDIFAETLGSIWAGVKQGGASIDKAMIGLLASIASSMGDFFVKEGLTFIAAGTARSIFGMPNGPALIAAGAGEVAAGTVLKALGAAGSKRAGGGGMGRGYGGGAGVYGGFQAGFGGGFEFGGGGVPGRGTAGPEAMREGRVVVDVTHLSEKQIVTDIPGFIENIVTEINRAAKRDIEINFTGE